jgi:long-chain acyl-CoA synthetase
MFDFLPRQSDAAVEELPGETIPALFHAAVARRGERVAMRQKDFGLWKPVTWRELGDIAREIGMGLVSLGFAPGECASILSNTNKEWVFADYAILGAAGVANGIYPTDAPPQCEYLLADSASVFVFVEDEEQLDKLLEVRARLPKLRKIICFDMEGLARFSDPQVISLDGLRALGREHAKAHPDLWMERGRMARPEDLAVLVYTSGTTGKPKGAMISHANIVATMRGLLKLAFRQNAEDERMCFLPLCHIAERMGGEYLALGSGTILNFVENPETVPENVREIQPTVFTAVPRIWEIF